MYQPDLLKGKRVLITGGGTGLGKEAAARIMALGGEPVIVGRRAEVLAAAADELITKTGGRISWKALDIRDADGVDAVVGEIWADAPVDALINNAAGNFLARTETLSHRAVDAVVNIVLHGGAYMTLACGKRWLAHEWPGNVISIVTTYAWTGSAYVVPSAMAKAGVLAMTRSLAVEWGGRGIRLNAIAPGPFPTEGAWSRLAPNDDLAKTFETRNPLNRPGTKEEFTNLVAFLLSDGAAYINGEVVTIDGGEWLEGAGQFNFAAKLTDDEWDAIRPGKG